MSVGSFHSPVLGDPFLEVGPRKTSILGLLHLEHMEQRKLETATYLLKTKAKILNKQVTNLRKSVEKLYQDLCDVLRGEDGRKDKRNCKVLAEL